MLFETGLLLLLLRALGKIRQQGGLSPTNDVQFPNLGGLAVDERAPSFVATDQQGNEISLKDFQGKQRVLAFVSPDCPACAGAIEALNAALRDEQSLVVLVVGGSDFKANHEFAIEHKASMPILTAPFKLVKDLYRIREIPFVFVLDERGIIRTKGVVNNYQHLQDLLKEARKLSPVHR